MKVGILGSGQVAHALGAGFAKHGHTAMLGSRDAGKLANWTGQKGTFAEAAKFGELLVLAVKGSAAAEALEAAGRENVRGKVVIDTTNPIADAPPTHGVISYFTGPNDSLMERLQKAFPEAKLVKAFNSVGNALMVNPPFSARPTMFICGNDEGAKQKVGGILEQFGWETADMGHAESARCIEPLCQLWCVPGIAKGDWSPHAFKVLRQ